MSRQRLEVGDLVEVSDDGLDGNYAGLGHVLGRVETEYGDVWYEVELLDDFEGAEGAVNVLELPEHRLLFLSSGIESQPGDSQTGDLKDTNPKDAVGSDKLPIHLWPETATVMGTLGLLDGMLKYGRSNWRASGVRATIYIDALRRHTAAYAEGEDDDPDSGVPHLAHMLACIAILVDAEAAGMLTDDRNYPGGYRGLVDELTPHVARLKAKHANKNPKHYTIEVLA